jgi:hypothetical protein
MIPNLEQTLIEKIHVLPPEKQAKVLEYVQEIEISENRQTNGDESKENLLKSNTKYAVHSVYNSFEAGDAMMKLLEEENAKLEKI